MASSSTTNPPTSSDEQSQPFQNYLYTVNVNNFVSSKLSGDRNSNNYFPWKQQILCLIESQDLLRFIDGTIPPPQPPPKVPSGKDINNNVAWRTDRVVKGWILSTLADTLLKNAARFTTARDVWLELEKTFASSGAPGAALQRNEADADEAFASINRKSSQLSKSQTQRCIYKVKKHLRDINEKAYEPEIMAIGPYHHGKDTLQMMEEHKLRYFDRLRDKRNIKEIISAIGELGECARDCYGEPISLSQAKFIEILVLDGCFIIGLIKREYLFREMDSILSNMLRDLILFENQIPFFVLCTLFELIEGSGQYNDLIYLVLDFFKSYYPGAVHENRTDIDWGEIKHLLHLIHTVWRPSFDTPNSNVFLNPPSTASCLDKTKHFLHLIPAAWRASFVAQNKTKHSHSLPSTDPRLDSKSRFIHSATELKDANVTFSKPKSDRNGNTLFHVGFENGAMEMPPLTIEDRTECFFRNLIAYEQYIPDSEMNYVTDYVRLLDCLINSSGDVKTLSKCGIIINWLGDNEAVARVFNRLMESVCYIEQKSNYVGMMDRVNEHYSRRRNRWMAVLKRDYFNSPWTILAFISAVVLLFLTVAQTVLSALQLN